MKILVVGASKGTGAECVKAALAAGHEVTAFARTPTKLTLEDAKLNKVAGDFHDADSVKKAVPGHDAVIVTASVSSLSDFKRVPDYFSRGTRFCIDAMKASGVKRLVVLSAQGSGESRAGMNPVIRFIMVDGILKRAFADHDVQERATRESGLAWIVARPSRLTDGPAKNQYVRESNPEAKVPSSISRADVAAFMVEACGSSTLVDKAWSLGG